MKNLEHKYIQIKTPPLMIVDTMLQITETIRPKIDLSTLSPTCKTINHFETSFPVLPSNHQFLLMYHEVNLCLVDQQMNIIKETIWPFNHLVDMC
jgi:hypothetical protein